jgi:hypothetical protein
MIDSTKEHLLSLAEATKLIPAARDGKRTHTSTLLRWIVRGTQSPEGKLVRLEAVRFGSRWFTTAEAIRRFSERLTPTFDDATGLDRLGA